MVEEFGIVSYCYESTLCRIDGFTNLSTTISSAILERMSVKDIRGLKCLFASA